jgi:hypothetical protein
MGIASFGNKDRSWNDKKLLKTQLKEWEIVANKYLENAKVVERIDSRSYAEQGVPRIPQIHLGKDVTAMRRRGVPTERGDIYDQIDQANEDIRANLEQIYESSSVIEQIKKEAAAAQKREADERAERTRKLIETEIQQRQEAERQRVELEIQRQNDLRDRERQEKLEWEKALQHIKEQAEQDTIEFLRAARSKFAEITDTSKNLRESRIEQVVEVKKEIEPEQPKFTIGFMIEAFTHMVEQYPKGQKCEISKIVDNFLNKAMIDDPSNELSIHALSFRIRDRGRRNGTDLITLDSLVSELKFARDNPMNKTMIQTTRSKNIDYSGSESQSQDQGYSM